ncbi:hypothetical protein K435DRAFT_840000 [Dendrothele bispora CBS 962.96]|uniref:CCHC-type domain-containing protein n=1 Tax=Dendrothele bispora (strain CBS 962.96) TaxID=1314807 RepID=A0A4S8LXY3_DENBC|nr:hypothetical protein K435DRAFT_840000 [Dendrothele bispora CBS 962.96]
MSDFRILLSLAGKADPLRGESNWSAWKRDLPMVLDADGPSWDIVEGTTPLPPVTDADARSLYNLRNKQARTVIWSMINRELHPIILDKATGKDAYAALKAKFESTSWARRVALRTALHRVVHDPSKRIDVYIESLKDLRRQLKDMGTKVGDDYFKDILLTNLDHSFAHVRTSLLSQPSGGGEAKLATVIDTLLSSSPSVNFDPETSVSEVLGDQPHVKLEPTEGALYMRSRSGGKAGNGKGVSRPVGAGGSGGGGNAKGVSSSGSGEVKGYFSNGKLWGDMERDGCHRCGGIGHKAAWCVADMPDDVKRWCLNRSAESSHVVSDGSVGMEVIVLKFFMEMLNLI